MSDSESSDASQASGAEAAGTYSPQLMAALVELEGLGAATRASDAASKASVASRAAWEAAITCKANSVRRAALARTTARLNFRGTPLRLLLSSIAPVLAPASAPSDERVL